MVVEGTPAPNTTVTLGVRVDGEPVENATVTRDGVVVGQTDADGHVEVTIPGGESEFETVVSDTDAELELSSKNMKRRRADRPIRGYSPARPNVR